MIKEINSIQNQTIKDVFQLKEKSRIRKKKGLFLIEGLRELVIALEGGYVVEKLIFLSEIIEHNILLDLFEGKTQPDYISVNNDVYKKLAYRESTEGVIAVARTKDHSIKNLKLKSKTPLILIVESIEKPGNIGAMLRTADAANIDAVIIANPKSDIYNPNVVRSSVGCVFTNNVVTGSTDEVIEWLRSNDVNIYSAALTASKPYYEINYKQASAIVVGTEATGLSNEWLKASTQNIIIPMEGAIDSMNVSVAAAIMLFEAKRQRLDLVIRD
ncbi:MAG: RNA methyltransferase [Ichthyobacteriaceae bacterium]|nr:RNA methyltransferase [Ichthyobacteriaceae bacterium]